MASGQKFFKKWLGRVFAISLICYAIFLSVFQRKSTEKCTWLSLFRRLFSCEEYTASPFVMYVNAYLHTICAQFMASCPLIDEPILELGAGDGSFSELTLTEPRVMLVSSFFASDATYLRKRSAAERVAIIDAENIPLESESIKFIFMINVFYHIRDQRRAMSEIARVLAPGGAVAFNYLLKDEFASCFPLQRLLSSFKLKSLRDTDWERIKRRHYIDQINPIPSVRVLIEREGLEILNEVVFASIKAMRKAYFLYWSAAHSDPKLLNTLVEVKLVRNIIDAILDHVFYPLAMRDTEDCKRSGGVCVWFVLKKKGDSPQKIRDLKFVCPLCRKPLKESCSCVACGRTFPLVEGVPLFLVH